LRALYNIKKGIVDCCQRQSHMGFIPFSILYLFAEANYIHSFIRHRTLPQMINHAIFSSLRTYRRMVIICVSLLYRSWMPPADYLCIAYLSQTDFTYSLISLYVISREALFKKVSLIGVRHEADHKIEEKPFSGKTTILRAVSLYNCVV